jgi:hypothetical protein
VNWLTAMARSRVQRFDLTHWFINSEACRSYLKINSRHQFVVGVVLLFQHWRQTHFRPDHASIHSASILHRETLGRNPFAASIKELLRIHSFTNNKASVCVCVAPVKFCSHNNWLIDILVDIEIYERESG